MHKCTCAGMGVQKWTCICTWVCMPLKSTPWAHPVHCTLGKQCAPPLTSGPESSSCRGVSTDLANNTHQTLMYSLRVTWFVDFYRNPINRHFKGGKIAILSVQSSSFCEAKAAFELVNNPWLSAILTGMVFGIWNAAFNGSVPRKLESHLKDHRVSRVILPDTINFAYEREWGFPQKPREPKLLIFQMNSR